MRVVLDTNILVSGLLTPLGRPAAILRAFGAGEFDLYLDGRILAEYVEVLPRRELRFEPVEVLALLKAVVTHGHQLSGIPSAEAQLDDRKDQMFLDVALACHADYLVTGNLKHFPSDKTKGTTVVSPRQFLYQTTP